MTTKDRKAVLDKIKAKRNEIKALREELNKLDEEKEGFYDKREEYSKQISELIAGIKELRKERNSYTDRVKSLKDMRRAMQDSVKSLIDEIKKINEEKSKATGVNIDPIRLKRQIDKMEEKLETEPMSFQKEQALMKAIKDLKKQYKETEGASAVFKEYSKVSRQIDVLKAEVKKLHRQVQQVAAQSQEKHDSMLEFSKSLDELKIKEEAALKKFIDSKKRFQEHNELLKKELQELNELNKLVDAGKKQAAQERQKNIEDVMKSKELAVEDKIRKGKKLTTEDLLVFQKDN